MKCRSSLSVLSPLLSLRMSGPGEQTDILAVGSMVRERWRVVSCFEGAVFRRTRLQDYSNTHCSFCRDVLIAVRFFHVNFHSGKEFFFSFELSQTIHCRCVEQC